jgi:hypothetical protein
MLGFFFFFNSEKMKVTHLQHETCPPFAVKSAARGDYSVLWSDASKQQSALPWPENET